MGSSRAKAMEKVRVDRLMVEQGLAPSRHKAQALVMGGKVRVNGVRVDKAGTLIPLDSEIEISEDLPYVSRGGLKLEAALRAFSIDPRGRRAMDIGASTGGFTDCLLKHGADEVVAVDVGYGQLDWSLRNDPRVILLEKTNIRYLNPEASGGLCDLITIDVSFISLSLVLPKALEFLSPGGTLVALIKPQFEVGPSEVGKGGIVREPAKHQRVVSEVCDWARGLGLELVGTLPSPLTGAKGNREFIGVWIKPRRE
ncbi:MAG: TlyA family RNA methyltransferase [Thermodesulfobacteriota bacterium]